jgi:hypothetical protein
MIPAELAEALRRIRFEGAIALSEQQHLPDAERLAAELNPLIAAYAEHRGGPRLAALIARLGLQPVDELALLTALAVDLDPIFAINVCALLGAEPRRGVSSRLLSLVMRYAGDEGMELQLDRDHPLVRAGVLEVTSEPGTPKSLATWVVSPRTITHLCGSDELDPVLRRCAHELVSTAGTESGYATATLQLLERAIADREQVVVCIEGPDGVGRRTLAAVAASEHGRQIIALDASRASIDPLAFRAEIRALVHECWLRDAVPLVARVDLLGARSEHLVALRDGLLVGPTLFTAMPGTALPELDARVIRTRIDPPAANARARIWTKALGGAFGLPAELTEVVRQYSLTPGSIGRAAANARMLSRGRELVGADIRAGVAAEVAERFGELASRVTVTQTWDDLVLPDDTLDDIKAFVSRAAQTSTVYDQWGFRDKLQRGLGLAALFSGPPGTGKTMVAGLIANSLNLDLYQVDLSQVVSKWIGETEKSLARIFDAASMGHVLLLFDEADSLFAKRTEVKSSNDRYANLEVNYLLQRIESFSGVAVLTTNLDSSVDPAFKRRLAVEIPFYAPEVAERQRLWQAMLPAAAPRAADLDFAQLARGFEDLCGGNIRNAVLRAAFLAAAESSPIGQSHLMRAARSEYRAMGKVAGG